MSRLAGYGWCWVLGAAAVAPASFLSAAPPAAGFEQRVVVKNASQSYLGIDVRAIGDDQVAALKLKDTRARRLRGSTMMRRRARWICACTMWCCR